MSQSETSIFHLIRWQTTTSLTALNVNDCIDCDAAPKNFVSVGSRNRLKHVASSRSLEMMFNTN